MAETISKIQINDVQYDIRDANAVHVSETPVNNNSVLTGNKDGLVEWKQNVVNSRFQTSPALSNGWYRVAKVSKTTIFSGIYIIEMNPQGSSPYGSITFAINYLNQGGITTNSVKVLNYTHSYSLDIIDKIRIAYDTYNTSSGDMYLDIHTPSSTSLMVRITQLSTDMPELLSTFESMGNSTLSNSTEFDLSGCILEPIEDSNGNLTVTNDIKSKGGDNSLNTLATKVAALEANPSPYTIKVGMNNTGSGSCIGYGNLTGDNNYGVSIGSFNSNNKDSVVIGVGAASELQAKGSSIVLSNGAWSSTYTNIKTISNDGYGNNFILEEGGNSILGNSSLLADLAYGMSKGTILISKNGAAPSLLTYFTSENLSQPVSNFSIRVTFDKNLKNELGLTSGELTGTNVFYAWPEIKISKASHPGVILVGQGLISGKVGQIVLGNYNKEERNAYLVIGVGSSEMSRLNALTVDSSGVSFPLGLRSAYDVTSNNGTNSLNTLATKVAALEANPKNISFIKPSEYAVGEDDAYPTLHLCLGNPSAFGSGMNADTIKDDMLHSDGYRFNNIQDKPIYLKFMGMTTDDEDMNTATFSLMDGEGNIYLLKADADNIISFTKKS